MESSHEMRVTNRNGWIAPANGGKQPSVEDRVLQKKENGSQKGMIGMHKE
jgi:hypothetical protein